MRSILICFIVAVWFRVNAQVTNDTIPKNVGAVEDAEILITKSRKLSLSSNWTVFKEFIKIR